MIRTDLLTCHKYSTLFTSWYRDYGVLCVLSVPNVHIVTVFRMFSVLDVLCSECSVFFICCGLDVCSGCCLLDVLCYECSVFWMFCVLDVLIISVSVTADEISVCSVFSLC